jgi:hypothetical protein
MVQVFLQWIWGRFSWKGMSDTNRVAATRNRATNIRLKPPCQRWYAPYPVRPGISSRCLCRAKSKEQSLQDQLKEEHFESYDPTALSGMAQTLNHAAREKCWYKQQSRWGQRLVLDSQKQFMLHCHPIVSVRMGSERQVRPLETTESSNGGSQKPSWNIRMACWCF